MPLQAKFHPLSRFSPAFQCLLLLAICIITILIIRDGSVVHLIHSSPSSPPVSNLPTREDWTFAHSPQFCNKIIHNPLQFVKCSRDRRTQTCRNGTVTMMSQYAQDYYLYTRHFSHLKRRGIYVDIATNDPTFISNTYFMDVCLGWDGICVEANPRYFDDIRKLRSCKLIDTCVSNVQGEKVTFILGGGFGGINDTNKNLNSWLKDGRAKGEIQLQCITMANVIRQSQVYVIDYLSLDVEGHELKVLQGFDWEHVQVNVMTIEGNEQALRQISEFLLPKGYVRHRPTLNERTNASNKLYGDAVFLHESVSFGDPK